MKEKININVASAKALTALDGVGPVLAKKIVKYRKKNGRFKTADELINVSSFTKSLFSKNKKRIALTNKEVHHSQKEQIAKKKLAKKKRKQAELIDTVVVKAMHWLGRKLTNSKKKDNYIEDELQAKSKAKIIRKKPLGKANQKEKKRTTEKENFTKEKSTRKTKAKVIRKFPLKQSNKKKEIQKSKTRSSSKSTTKKRQYSNKKSSSQTLTNTQIQKAAKRLGVEAAAIKAVIDVESSGGGFLKNGKPKILFEGHIFWTQLQAKGISPSKHRKGNEHILYPNWTRKYYQGGNAEHHRLASAMKINREAALASASWGMFQVMGFNYFVADFPDVESFVEAQHQSEYEHLKAFLGYIKHNRLVKHLKTKNWAKFAAGYNGKDYKKNKYDIRLALAYKKHS